MVVALAVFAALLAVVVLVMFGVLVEFQRQISQLRRYLGLENETQPMPFSLDVDLRSLGLPSLGDLTPESRTAVLVLSDHCTTCFEIADGLPASIPTGLVVLVEAASAVDATAWLASHDLAAGPSILYDSGGVKAGLLGIQGTPTVVRFEGLGAVSASNVPSLRQLYSLVEWLEHRPVEDLLPR